jgi:hypothetical protein
MAISVRTTPRLFAPFYTKKHDQLAKTGSGQTSKNSKKEMHVFRAGRAARA